MPTSRPPVVSLLGGCRPAAVSGRIRPVIVVSLYRHARRRLAHVGEEIFKDEPPVADRNAAPAVVSEARVFRIATPLQHGRPTGIGARLCASRRVPVLGVPRDQFLAVRAPATCRSAAKVAGKRFDSVSAVAAAKPLRRSDISNGDKSPEALTGNISKRGHIHFNGILRKALP